MSASDTHNMSKKRKTTEGASSSPSGERATERQWHPEFRADRQRVTLSSSDNQLFSVDKDLLARNSPVFKDMFELSHLSTEDNEEDAIPIGEEGVHLAAFLGYITVPSTAFNAGCMGVAETAAIISISETFNFEAMRSAAEIWMGVHLQTMWTVLQVASRRQDVILGRRAIGVMNPQSWHGRPTAFWRILDTEGLRAEWQVEMARHIFPVLVYGQTEWTSTMECRWVPASAEDVKRAAALFNPK